MRHSGVMELLHLLGRFAREADRAAVGEGCWLTVDRFTDTEGVAVMPVKESALPRTCVVAKRCPGAEHAQHGIIKVP